MGLGFLGLQKFTLKVNYCNNLGFKSQLLGFGAVRAIFADPNFDSVTYFKITFVKNYVRFRFQTQVFYYVENPCDC